MSHPPTSIIPQTPTLPKWNAYLQYGSTLPASLRNSGATRFCEYVEPPNSPIPTPVVAPAGFREGVGEIPLMPEIQ